jgi:hypothetical protein
VSDLVAEVFMGKKKTGDRAKSTNVTPNAVVVRGCREWHEWLKELAEHDRTSMAETIDRALIDYARKVGFKKGAPER